MGRVASGSPWNDNFLTEQMVSQVKISHPIAIRRSSLRNLYEDDDNPIDANSLYVKGEATIPLESPIKRELGSSIVCGIRSHCHRFARRILCQ